MTNNMFAIPAELRALRQWCLWKYEDKGSKKPTKVPYQPNSYMADATNPDTWSSFDEVFNTLQFGGYDGLGFVFSANDPYAGIDLDDCEGNKVDLDRQLKIFREFDSYAEISPSGNGLHIIVKGSVPQGRRRAHIEIYSSGRYFTMTGNVYNNKPIADRHEMLNMLFQQMGGPPSTLTHTGDAPETMSDEEIITKASSAVNGDKFRELYSGNWNAYYPSQSEADFAIVDIIAFYTQNRNQIARIFQSSQLGKRDKSRRKDYQNYMITKSFDRQLPPIDMEGFQIAVENKLNDRSARLDDDSITVLHTTGANNSQIELPLNNGASSNGKTTAFDAVNAGSTPAALTSLPPGLLGEIAQYVYAQAPRQVEEIALAAAIGLMAGICGRAYNVSSTGLNQYVMLIAPTGVGKEAMASGIEKLMSQVTMMVPPAHEFLGPSEIASGQALVRFMAKTSQCFLSVMGEVGLRIQQISSHNATSAEISLRRMLLELYNKSGQGQVVRPSIYADSDKNTIAIPSPAFSILGESTPERFYASLNEDMIGEGLLPRFFIIEYNGERRPSNVNHASVQPSLGLIDKLATLCAHTKTLMAGQKVVNINYTSEAKHDLDRFDKYADERINSTDKEFTRQLWNRAHIKSLKLAALIAVGVNPYNPIIQIDHVEWAINMVRHDIQSLSNKFDQGLIGQNVSGESRQIEELKRVIKQFIISTWDDISKYKPDQRLHSAKIIPYAFLNKRLVSMAAFRNDKLNSTQAIKRALQNLIDGDFIREVPKNELATKYGTTQRAFMVTNMSILD